ncbi:hypothetical protein DPMN_112752 [Dreissena polymorpha]|uniref:Uncharacterized protein n=1 Tax=Dreissena polymorpha TaxID=45954 RepID=A0A9D4QQ61_DREPO|nr:hypothetical protein DPMN_112752 [Dreissena polymorpha]
MGLSGTIWKQLEELDFSDDLALPHPSTDSGKDKHGSGQLSKTGLTAHIHTVQSLPAITSFLLSISKNTLKPAKSNT